MRRPSTIIVVMGDRACVTDGMPSATSPWYPTGESIMKPDPLRTVLIAAVDQTPSADQVLHKTLSMARVIPGAEVMSSTPWM